MILDFTMVALDINRFSDACPSPDQCLWTNFTHTNFGHYLFSDPVVRSPPLPNLASSFVNPMQSISSNLRDEIFLLSMEAMEHLDAFTMWTNTTVNYTCPHYGYGLFPCTAPSQSQARPLGHMGGIDRGCFTTAGPTTRKNAP